MCAGYNQSWVIRQQSAEPGTSQGEQGDWPADRRDDGGGGGDLNIFQFLFRKML